MHRIAVCFLVAFGLSLGVVGCAEKTQVKETKTTTTPGGTTTETKVDEVKKTGDNKDAAPPANP
ncbi:MAG TPA: hypothetical protein VKH44_02120 [Pirellulaceae bacterium]|nr:hypothetical protein [Pirellulaceae bacterium]